MTKINLKIFINCLILLLGLAIAGNVAADISKRKNVKRFINEMVKQEGFDQAELNKVFKQVKIRNSIIKAIKRPWEAKPWYQYRPIFLKQDRINGGVEFWTENEETLNRAAEKYGVPPEIVTAIIGVETKYGQHKGKFPVMDALSTLAFAYPKRAKFFRKELKEYLILTREEKVDPMSILGSYAGAMGKPQFIPSSYRRYAVDFNGDGKRDLFNTVDVIGSVANYFKAHRWTEGQPVTALAKVKGKSYKKVVKKGIKPHTTVKALAKQGITAKTPLPKDKKAALIELELKKGKEHWLGLNNFYVITRYNHSQHYAMAVYQLSQEIKARKNALAQKAKAEKDKQLAKQEAK